MRSLLGMIFAVLISALPASAQSIERSVIGIDGLSHLLREANIAQRRSNPFITRDSDEFSLRILPLYDVDLRGQDGPPLRTPHDSTLRDISQSVARQKISALPSLVILPKWRRGFKDAEVAHESLLVPTAQLNELWTQLFDTRPTFERLGARFAPVPWDGGDLALFHAQGIPLTGLPYGCIPKLSDGKMVFVLACSRKGATNGQHDTYVILDPDLMNAHGLGLADNAAFAVDLIQSRLRDDTRPIYIDTSTEILLDAEPVGYEKQSLAHFFAYPLSVLWGIFALILAALMWRGWRRFGKPVPRPSGAHELSQTAAIGATARLLRLSGHDGPPVADFVRAQLGDLAIQVFGPQGGGANGQKRLFEHIAKQDPALAKEFEASALDLIARAPELPRNDLYRKLHHYSSLLEKVADCHGTLRISGRRPRAAQ